MSRPKPLRAGAKPFTHHATPYLPGSSAAQGYAQGVPTSLRWQSVNSGLLSCTANAKVGKEHDDQSFHLRQSCRSQQLVFAKPRPQDRGLGNAGSCALGQRAGFGCLARGRHAEAACRLRQHAYRHDPANDGGAALPIDRRQDYSVGRSGDADRRVRCRDRCRHGSDGQGSVHGCRKRHTVDVGVRSRERGGLSRPGSRQREQPHRSRLRVGLSTRAGDDLFVGTADTCPE